MPQSPIPPHLSPRVGVSLFVALAAAGRVFGFDVHYVEVSGVDDVDVNGLYRKDSATCFRKHESSTNFLCKVSSGHWALQDDTFKGSDHAYIVSKSDSAGTPENSTEWMTWNETNHSWFENKRIEVKRVYRPEREQPNVVLSGVSGYPAGDGEYAKEPWPSKCYAKVDRSQHFLCQCANGYWCLQGSENKGADTGFVTSGDYGTEEPQSVTRWMERDLVRNRWREADSVRCFAVNRREPGDKPLSGSTAGIVAVLLLGTLLTLVAFIALRRSWDKYVRSFTYRIISWAMMILVAAGVASALWGLLFDGLLANILKNSKSTVEINIGLLVFILSFIGIQPLLWKVQYHDQRVLIVKHLGAYIVGFLGIFAFLQIQKSVVTENWGIGNVNDRDFRRAAALMVAFLAWLVISVLIMVQSMIQGKLLSHPPKHGWPPKEQKERAPPPPPKRGCATFTLLPCATVPPPSAPADALEDDSDDGSWKEAVEHAHADVVVFVVAFLLNQFVFYSLNGMITGKVDLEPGDADHPGFWRMATFLFLLATIVVFTLRTLKPAVGGMFMAIVEHVFLYSFAWGLCRMISWKAHSLFSNRSEVLINFLSALMASALTVSFLFLLSLAVEPMASSKGGPMKWLFKNTHSGTVRRAMLMVVECFGLLIGMSLFESFHVALGRVVQGAQPNGNVPMLLMAVLTAMFALLIFYPWRTWALPKAEMHTEEHQAQIDHEKRRP